MPSSYLNYTVVGHEAFEVLPYYVSAFEDGDLVAEVLASICSIWGVPHRQQKSYFWLVCNIKTLNHRAKEQLTFF